VVAIILFVFVGLWGAGDFYTGYIAIGVVKVVLSAITMFTPVIGWVVLWAWCIAGFIWNIVYIVQFANEDRQDSNGYNLY